MSLWGFFAKSPAEETFLSAQKAARAGNFSEALRLLSFAFEKDSAYQPLYALASECLRETKSEEEATLFDVVLENFSNPQVFYDLGYHFVDVQMPRLAIPFLERAYQLDPKNLEIAVELAVAYRSHFRPQKAKEILTFVDTQQQFWPEFEFYWCSLLSGDVSGIPEFIDSCRKELQGSEADEMESCLVALNRLEECFARYSLLETPDSHLQPWQFIQYGTAILDYFESDEEQEESPPVTGGRWVMVWGSSQSLSLILEQLKQWLLALNRTPQKILAGSDRDSEILARILSQRLQLPCEFLNETNSHEPNTLIVFADNRDIQSMNLESVQPNQTLFAFNLHWLAPALWTPDVAGLATQQYFFPWNAGFRFDPTSQKMQKIPPDQRSPEVIASELAKTSIEEVPLDSKFTEILQFYQKYRDYLKGGKKGGSRRLRFRTDSPIPSSFFC